MRRIVFHQNGFGDLLVCFKALYAIKCLYPKDKLILAQKGFSDESFLQNIPFIDEIYTGGGKDFENLKSDIFITNIRSSHFFKTLHKFQFKRIIAQPHLLSLLYHFDTPLPYRRTKLHMSEIALKLVRVIDKKHYDTNFSKINFKEVRNLLPSDTILSDEFFKQNTKFSKIIALNIFGNQTENIGFNPLPRTWLNLSQNLAKEHPEILFVLVNFTHNTLQFNLKKQANLKVFINNDSIASLVAFCKRLDGLISVDTGIVHLCDILQIPSLIFIPKHTFYRFSGGSYGGVCDKFSQKNGYQKNYAKIMQNFYEKANHFTTRIKNENSI
ncbi:glycosyltransferase family 9 protein [Campylobacter upsaliensis]|nr:lipopolysaccharide heptosyltransferase family protein [Campylobacter upsaliensis]EAH5847983.1 lipopolysaccharide heptosyltransferase family protein [Campylobacter upsaliensis]EAI7264545.1 glycosyltransferase family 9 protein [Campylobacter upsaliensis]EAJ7398840.1 glycosyltransferase family 9 protein [Campylobacter upsaliensis]EAK0964137.1 glycosyltransferase family 9 protein [Campylobacter upsaliensis]